MLTSLGYVFLLGLIAASLLQKMKLPRIIGMLLVGIAIGPFALNLLDDSILTVSADLRKLALVVILIKAGLSLNLQDLKKVGRPALLMSFLPAVFEILAFVLLAPRILGIDRVEAAVVGAVLGAVSPAVVVPRMVELMEKKYGTEKGIPQLILAGASLDDVFVIVLFSTFVAMAQGGSAKLSDFAGIPVSIVMGLLLGAAVGYLMAKFFEARHRAGHTIRNSVKVIILLGIAFALLAAETRLEPVLPVSGLLAIMAMAMAVAMYAAPSVTDRLRAKYGKLWLGSEIILFVLVGAAVDIRYTLISGAGAVAMILIGLAFRSVGVVLSVAGTNLNFKERLYCVLAYLPKATVQAAIGGVPLALGLPCGKLVLSVAVLSILLTAPLGAICMDLSYGRLLTKEE